MHWEFVQAESNQVYLKTCSFLIYMIWYSNFTIFYKEMTKRIKSLKDIETIFEITLKKSE